MSVVTVKDQSTIIVRDNAVVGPQGHQGVQGATGSQGPQGATGAGGGANTANVTFQDNIVIGTGAPPGVGQSDGLYLAAGTGQVGNLQYLRLRGGDDDAHIHFDTANVEAYDLYIGDDNKYVKLERGYSGNVVIGSSHNYGMVWKFDIDGKIGFPLLNSDRGDISSGTVYGNTLKFANSTLQAIIAGPEGTDTNPSAERMVIEGGKGYTGTGGEGGDIYLWAGRGGDAGGTGGDIKIRGGYGYSEGGYIRIDGGDTAAGFGGNVEITGGSSSADHGGEIRLIGGYGANGYGNVRITSASKNWLFNNDGNTIFPNTAYQTIHLGTNSYIKYINDLILQQSGNADPDTFYTYTEQEDRYWETFTQKDVTGGNSAWSWIHSEMSDANTPYVLIETKKLDESPKTWLFTANGRLKMPGAINFQQNATIPLGKPAVNGANDRITLWDFEGGGTGYNYAIGAEGNHMWFTMDVNNGTGGFKFYSRDNQVFKIRDDGALIFSDNSTQNTAYDLITATTQTGSAILQDVGGTINTITSGVLSLRVVSDSGTAANLQYSINDTVTVKGRTKITTSSSITPSAVSPDGVTTADVWYSLGTVSNVGDLIESVITDHSYHNVYRITFVARQIASGPNVATGYAAIERLQRG